MTAHALSSVHFAPAGIARTQRVRWRASRWLLAACLLSTVFATAAATRTRVVAWGGEVDDKTLNIPYSLDDAVALAVPYVLRANGEVLEMGQMPPVVRARNAKGIAATFGCLMILRRNGRVVTQGTGSACAYPVPAGLSNVIGIDIGSGFALALKADGRVVAWGANWAGQTDVPVGLSNVIAIAAGRGHALALRNTGEVVGWGSNGDGELDFPSGLTDVVAIDAGGAYNQALKADGTVLAWGDIYDSPRPVPLDLPPAQALGAGEWRRAAAVLRDGTIREWGFLEGKALPPGLGNVSKLAMGYVVNYALVTRPITPAEAIADMRVDLDDLLAIEPTDRDAMNYYLDQAAATLATDRALACTSLRSFGELAGDPVVMTYEDKRLYFIAQTRDVLRLVGCGSWRGP